MLGCSWKRIYNLSKNGDKVNLMMAININPNVESNKDADTTHYPNGKSASIRGYLTLSNVSYNVETAWFIRNDLVSCR